LRAQQWWGMPCGTGGEHIPCPPHLKEAPGRWAGKESGHVPKVRAERRNIEVVTPHPMIEKHFTLKSSDLEKFN